MEWRREGIRKVKVQIRFHVDETTVPSLFKVRLNFWGECMCICDFESMREENSDYLDTVL
jgi:hypothetical protein